MKVGEGKKESKGKIEEDDKPEDSLHPSWGGVGDGVRWEMDWGWVGGGVGGGVWMGWEMGWGGG